MRPILVLSVNLHTPAGRAKVCANVTSSRIPWRMLARGKGGLPAIVGAARISLNCVAARSSTIFMSLATSPPMTSRLRVYSTNAPAVS